MQMPCFYKLEILRQYGRKYQGSGVWAQRTGLGHSLGVGSRSTVSEWQRMPGPGEWRCLTSALTSFWSSQRRMIWPYLRITGFGEESKGKGWKYTRLLYSKPGFILEVEQNRTARYEACGLNGRALKRWKAREVRQRGWTPLPTELTSLLDELPCYYLHWSGKQAGVRADWRLIGRWYVVF